MGGDLHNSVDLDEHLVALGCLGLHDPVGAVVGFTNRDIHSVGEVTETQAPDQHNAIGIARGTDLSLDIGARPFERSDHP